MTRKIEILDSIMGSGKTQGIIKWMLDNPNNKYLYVSPLLSEVEERIPSSCESLHFTYPHTDEHKSKSQHLLALLEEGYNISFTHSLFENLTPEHLFFIRHHGYTLIIDEEVDFVEPYQGKDYSKDDILTLERSGHVKVNEENLGRLEWTWEEDKFIGGNYEKLRNMCNLEMIHCAKRDRNMMVVHLPISLITSAHRCIVMTYLYSNSIMARFMEMKGIESVPFTEVEMMYTEADIKKRASDRIEFIHTQTMEKVKRYSMSSTWYRQTATKEQLKKVSNAIKSVCRLAESKRDVMFTFPKELKDSKSRRLNISGYADESEDVYWVYCGTKATNKYSHKKLLIHAFNRFPMQSVSTYLADYGFPINDDEYALSEMIQWIWRGDVRNEDGKIKLAILSPRMKRIFIHWLDGSEDSLKQV